MRYGGAMRSVIFLAFVLVAASSPAAAQRSGLLTMLETVSASLGSMKTMGAAPPPGATVLFGGSGADRFVMEKGGGPCSWPVEDGALVAGKGSIMTRGVHGDFELHLEFEVPEGVGNSGVYLQRRYEVQILNTWGKPTRPNHCGALYRFRKPDYNAALPPGRWQTYDITFRQPRWKDGKKTGPARITVLHNGIVVHQDVALTRKTGAGKKEGPEPGPILLQDHGARVRFRNIWVRSL